MVPYAFVWEKVKTMDFAETIVVHDIKVGRCSQLNEYMKLYEYQRSRSFIDFGANHSDSKFLNFFSSITADLTYPRDIGQMVLRFNFIANGVLYQFCILHSFRSQI